MTLTKDKMRAVRIAAFHLARKMTELENEDALYMWESGENKMEYEKLLLPGGSNERP